MTTTHPETETRRVEAAAEALLKRQGFGFCSDPMESGQDAYDITLEFIEDARAALAAADAVRPAESAIQARGEGTEVQMRKALEMAQDTLQGIAKDVSACSWLIDPDCSDNTLGTIASALATPATAPGERDALIGEKAKELCSAHCDWAEDKPCAECNADSDTDWRDDAEAALRTQPVVPADTSEARRADWLEERRDYWLGEAQRLALVVRSLGGEPSVGASAVSADTSGVGALAAMRKEAFECREEAKLHVPKNYGTANHWNAKAEGFEEADAFLEAALADRVSQPVPGGEDAVEAACRAFVGPAWLCSGFVGADDYRRRMREVLTALATPQAGSAPGAVGEVWGVEDTGDAIWVGTMRTNGSKIDRVVYFKDDLGLHRPEYVAQVKADARLICDSVNRAAASRPSAEREG